MRMERNRFIRQFAHAFNRFMHNRRRAGSRSVLQAQRIKRDARVQDRAQTLFIKIRIMSAFAAGRQRHNRNRHLMLQSGVLNRLAGNNQIVRIVQRVKVANRRHAVLFKQFSMQFDQIRGHGIQPDHVNAAGQRLQIGVRAGHFAEFIHHVESVFVTVKKG